MNQSKPVKDIRSVDGRRWIVDDQISVFMVYGLSSMVHYFTAAFVMATNSSIFRLAPPTSAPSISG